jgi:predicted nucleic acid-binding protein
VQASLRFWTISLPPVVVADANVVLSALIGGRASLLIASPDGPACVATQAVAEEIACHLQRLAAKRRLDQALMLAALQVMPISWKAESEYDDLEDEAKRRIAARDPDDWPTVALALKLALPVWSQDKDLRDAGVEASRPAICWTLSETAARLGSQSTGCQARVRPPSLPLLSPRVSRRLSVVSV